MFTQTGGGMSEGIANAGSLPATKKPQALINMTHSRNTHTYKAGFEWRNDIFSIPRDQRLARLVHLQRAADDAAVDATGRTSAAARSDCRTRVSCWAA